MCNIITATEAHKKANRHSRFLKFLNSNRLIRLSRQMPFMTSERSFCHSLVTTAEELVHQTTYIQHQSPP